MSDAPIETLLSGPAPTSSKCKGILVFLHGWPDTNALWSNQVSFFTKRNYHCVCLSLPNYSGYSASEGWGYDFPEVRDMLLTTIENISKGQKVHVVAHDWGAVLAYMIERKAPQLVKSLSAIDVAGRIKITSLAGKLVVPAYQLWLSSAFVLGNTVPVVGKPLGDLMTRACARYFAKAPDFSPNHGSHINYPYFYFYKALLFGGTGGTTYLKGYSPQSPTFYAYGSKKPFFFQSQGWIEEMERREDCQVKAYPCGHWVQVAFSQQLSEDILAFITAHANKD